MKIAIGNDHAGPDYKFEIIKYLKSKNITVDNYGTNSLTSVDYPDFVHPVAKAVNDNKVDLFPIISSKFVGRYFLYNSTLSSLLTQ